MKRNVCCNALALGLSLWAATSIAATTDAAAETEAARPDSALYQAHVGYGTRNLVTVAPRDGCDPQRTPGAAVEPGRDAWVDPARQVHGSPLLDNCSVTPEPDERDGVVRILPVAARS